MAKLTPEQKYLNQVQRIQNLYQTWARGMITAAERNIEIAKIITSERDIDTKRRLAFVFDCKPEWLR